ncbi:MAG: TonB-dependent receptor [Bacteroidota bacterium]
MRTILFLCMLLVSQHALKAQSNMLSGSVTDDRTGEPLIGVSIQIQGTRTGTVTNVDGLFSLAIPGSLADATLQFTYLGYKTVEVNLAEMNFSVPLDIEMKEDFIKGSEIVISGQGIAMEERRLSTDVVSISARQLENIPSTRIDELLQAQLPNAQVRLTNGQPGSSSIVRSRGVVSAFINSTPVVYVDGVRVDNLNTAATLGGGQTSGAATSALADIPAENIERVEFINGGAATTLYGSDGGNGVIQIFTKKSGAGDLDVTFSSQIGATTPTEDFLHFDRTSELLYQNGLFQNYNVTVSGGNNRLGYSFSGSHTDDEGFRIQNQNANSRTAFRTGFTAYLNDDLTFRSSLSYTRNNFLRVRNGNQGGYTGLWYTESGSSLFTGPGFNPNLDELSDADFALMQEFVTTAEALQDNSTSINRVQTSQSLEYNPVQNLVIRATAGFDYRVQDETIVTTNQYLNHIDDLSPENGLFNRGSIQNFNRNFLGLTGELTAQHRYELSDFSFISTVGGQFWRNEDRQVAYSGEDVRDGAQSIGQAAVTQSDEFYSEVANYGVYVQENIGYKNRYFVEFGLRGDGNTAFGDDLGTQFYPKVGASYLVSAEPFFFENIDPSIISYLKLQANYGVAGNFPQPFISEPTVDVQGFLNGQAATTGQVGNDDIGPEFIYTFETGADIGFINDRLSFGVNYYYSETRDALLFVPPAASVGDELILQNVGTIENWGWELSATVVPVLNRDWNVRLTASLNTLNNELTDAGGAAPFNINGFSSRTMQTVVQEGFPIGFLRGNTGTFVNGVMVSTTPQTPLGSTIADRFGSMSLNATYRNISLFSTADYQTGAFAHSFERQFRFRYGAASDNEGIPQAEVDANGTNNWLNFTDQFIESTDFFRIRLIGVNYSIPPSVLNNLVKRVTVGFSVTNPINFASSSFDPEATQSGGDQGQNGATTGGIAYAAESVPRQFLGSLRIDF